MPLGHSAAYPSDKGFVTLLPQHLLKKMGAVCLLDLVSSIVVYLLVVPYPNRLPLALIFLVEKYFLCQVVTLGRFPKQMMGRQTLTQAEIIKALTGQDTEDRKKALRCLFEHPRLRQISISYVRNHGGNHQDGEDVFQEAIILFDRKTREGAFLSQGSLEAYFMGIVRWHWFNEQQRSGRKTLLLENEHPIQPPSSNPETEYLITERREQLEQLLAELTDKCRNLLKLYQLNYSMEEIARIMGFANGDVSKKEAFLCRKRFKALLKTRPDVWNDLMTKEQL